MVLFIKRLFISILVALALFTTGLLVSGCAPNNIAESAVTAKELKISDRYIMEDSGIEIKTYEDTLHGTIIYFYYNNLGEVIFTDVVKE
jgi:hypothetical protein